MNGASLASDRQELEPPVNIQQVGSLLPLVMTIAVLAVFECILTVLNEDSPWSFWAVLAFIGYLIFLYRLAKFAPATVIILMPYLLISATEIASCVAIESGAWMDEISQAGFPTGGTARLAIALMGFLGVGAFFVEPAWKSHQHQSDVKFSKTVAPPPVIVVLTATFLCLFHNFYLVYIGLRRGFPLFNGIDRFRFRQELADPIFITLITSPAIFATALTLLVSNRSTRYLAWFLFLQLMFLQVLFGEKFTMLVVPTAIFSAAGLLGYLAQHKRLPITMIAVVGMVVGGTLMLTCLNYYFMKTGSLDAAQQMLLERMAEQGEMWYVGDRDFRYNTQINWPIIRQEIGACLGLRSTDPKEIGTEFGPYLVMEYYGDQEQLQVALEHSTYFAFTQTPYWLMISGYLGYAVVLLLTSVAYGIAGRLFLVTLLNRDLFAALLAQKAMLMVYVSTVVGWTYFALGYKTIGFMCFASIALYWRNLWQMFLPHRLPHR